MSYPEPTSSIETKENENNPILRSLSMSHNVAQSVLDEVSHMIHWTSPATLDRNVSTNSQRNDINSLRRSSSTSSLLRLRNSTHSYSGEETNISNAIPIKRTPTGRKFLYGYGRSLNSEQNSTLDGKLSHLLMNSYSGSKDLKRNDLLVGVVVSRWDNIVGPQCIYLWTEERTSTFYPGNLPEHLSRVVKYVTDHTVDHQDVDGNFVPPSVQRSTLCLVPDLSLAYMSLSIRIPSEHIIVETPNVRTRAAVSSVPHAVSILANLQFLSQFLLLRPLIFGWLAEFAPKIGVLLYKNKLQSSMINSWCAELCKTVTCVKRCWGQTISEALYGNSSKNGTKAPKSGKADDDSATPAQDDGDYLPPAFLNKSLWATLLTSHLTTCGTSVIVGSDHTAINKVIRFLLCFSTTQESYCSRYVHTTLRDTFMKGLFVQGLMLGEIGERSISFNQVTSNRYPSTHVELGAKSKIRQMLLELHHQQRDSILMQELTSLWTSTSFSSPLLDPFPHRVKEPAGFVRQLIEELLILPHERRHGRLLLFRRSIHAKAIALIAYLQSIIHKIKKERAVLLKSIPEALGLDEQEFLIIQVAADKIRPGLFQLMQAKD